MQPGNQIKIRLSDDLKAFVANEAGKYGSSLNSEIVRAIRERMERMQPATGESLQAAPVAGPNNIALQGGAITHG